MENDIKCEYAALTPFGLKSLCVIEAGENDNLIVQKLVANPNAIGIFGFSFLDQNADRLKGAIVEGYAPTFDNIAGGEYPISRSLYFYVSFYRTPHSPAQAFTFHSCLSYVLSDLLSSFL